MSHAAVEAANRNDLALLKKCLLVAGEFGIGDATLWNEALIRAANNGHAACVSLLLARGVDPDTPDSDYDTPLMLATSNNCREVVKILIKAGSDVNAISNKGRTALHMAGWNGNVHLVKVLLVAGTDPCIQDRFGETAIMLAAMNGHYDVVKLLLDAGSEVNITSTDADTALHWAAKQGHASVIRILIQAGAEKNCQNAWGATPLMLAVEWNRVSVIQTLLAERVNCNIQGGTDNQTALHIAARKGFKRCVEVLLARDAHPNLNNVRCFPPVMDAITGGHTSIVILLLKAGADIDTPLSQAIIMCVTCELDLLKVLVAASCHQSFANALLREVSFCDVIGQPTLRAIYAWLKEYTRFPDTLQQICRREMRKILLGKMHCSYSLPLPLNVKTYLNMYDL